MGGGGGGGQEGVVAPWSRHAGCAAALLLLASGVVMVSPGEEFTPQGALNSRTVFFQSLAQDLQSRGWLCGEAVVLPAGLSQV